jgi:hypothetical protein
MSRAKGVVSMLLTEDERARLKEIKERAELLWDELESVLGEECCSILFPKIEGATPDELQEMAELAMRGYPEIELRRLAHQARKAKGRL